MARQKSAQFPAASPLQQGLLADIGEHPDDDTPRLVYADWLEENGQPERAEFIRAQVELAKITEDDPRWRTLRRREARLLAVHFDDWMKGLPRWVAKEPLCTFRRGFVSDLSATASAFMRSLPELWKSTPLTGVRLRRANPAAVEALAKAPELGRLRSLDLTQNVMRTPGVRHLANSPYVANLTELVLNRNGIDAQAARALAESPNLSSLRSLSMVRALFGHHPLHALVASPCNLRLTRLNVGDGRFGGRLGPLVNSPNLAHLTDLDLHYTRLGDSDVEELVRSPLLPRLRALNVYLNNIGPAGLAALAETHQLARLNLSHNPVAEGIATLASTRTARHLAHLELFCTRDLDRQPQGHGLAVANALAGSPHLGNLRHLDLGHGFIRDAGLDALLASPHLTRLTHLILSMCNLNDAAIVGLASSRLAEQLATLDLNNNSIGERGVRAIASSPRFANLLHLELGGMHIGDRGAKSLAESAALAGLIVLRLGGNDIGHEGGMALAQSPHLAGLAELDLRHNPLGKRAQTALQNQFGRRVKL
jgi:uncharacterized protein (TIGR02996 family)